MKRFGAVGGILVVVIVVLAVLQLSSDRGDPGTSRPSGGPGMEHAVPEVLARRVLQRFDASLQLDRLSVEVRGAAAGGEAVLVFEYYTPLGDQSFRLPIVHRNGNWIASEQDLRAIEKRFER